MAKDDETLSIEIEVKGDAVVVRLSGSADMGSCHLLNERLMEASADSPKMMVLDLAGLDFICSLGLGSIVAAYLRMVRIEGRLRLVAPPTQVRELLRITKLDTLLEVHDSVDRAMTAT